MSTCGTDREAVTRKARYAGKAAPNALRRCASTEQPLTQKRSVSAARRGLFGEPEACKPMPVKLSLEKAAKPLRHGANAAVSVGDTLPCSLLAQGLGAEWRPTRLTKQPTRALSHLLEDPLARGRRGGSVKSRVAIIEPPDRPMSAITLERRCVTAGLAMRAHLPMDCRGLLARTRDFTDPPRMGLHRPSEKQV